LLPFVAFLSPGDLLNNPCNINTKPTYINTHTRADMTWLSFWQQSIRVQTPNTKGEKKDMTWKSLNLLGRQRKRRNGAGGQTKKPKAKPKPKPFRLEGPPPRKEKAKKKGQKGSTCGLRSGCTGRNIWRTYIINNLESLGNLFWFLGGF